MNRPLDPYERRVITDSLRPGPGSVLDIAVGTSYSVDLEALLIVPMAFAMFDTETTAGTKADPTALLAAIETYAQRIALYCDAAEIRSSADEARLFVMLEEVLKPVSAPGGGRFHPKVWVLRFKDDLGESSHRILIMTRNLTFDRSWDLIIRLDEAGGREGSLLGDDIAAFLTGLDALSPSEQSRSIASSVAGRRFMAPEPFETVRLHPIGLNGSGADPLAGQTGKKVLAISPFLGASRLRQIAETAPRARQRHLISLPLEMERLGGKALEPFGNLWRLHDEAGSNNEDDPSAEAGHGSGLHAKAYVIDREDGKKTTWFVGSPNATMSAFERNVEMLVELDGPSRKAGVNRILEEAGGEGVSFRSLLREFSPSGEEPIPDPLAEDEYRLEEIAREIAEKGVGLEARQDGRRWKVKLTLGSRPSGLLKADRLRARLATAGGRSGSGVRFTEVRPDERPSSTLTAARASAVTALIEFRLSSGARPKAPDRTFIVLGNLTGAPDDRRELLLLDLVEDEKRFRRLLFLLLASSDPGTDSASEARKFISATGTGDGGFPAEQGIPLFESLVRSYARDPERLRAVAGIVEQFQATEEGRKRLPEGFEDMWKAFAPEADK